jgi:peptidyl-prolyl cis-trans isomerase SurA
MTLVLAPMGCPDSVCAEEIYADRVAAVVNGKVILLSDVRKWQQPFIRSNFGMPFGVVPPGKWPTEKEVLDELVIVRLLEQEAREKGIEVPQEAVTKAIEAVQKRNRMTHDDFVLRLAGEGVNYSDYRKYMRRRMLLGQLIAMEVGKKIALSEEDAQQYFKEHQAEIEEAYRKLEETMRGPRPKPIAAEDDGPVQVPTHRTVYEGGQVRLGQITIQMPADAKPNKKKQILAKATRIYQDAIMGAEFGELARKYSEDQLASSGGDYGFMKTEDLIPQLQQIVRRMEVGDILPPIDAGDRVLLLHLADAKDRREKEVRIPKRERERLMRRIEEERKQLRALKERQKRSSSEDSGDKSARDLPMPELPPVKDLEILTPEEMEAYEEMRGKVYLLLKSQKNEERMESWIKDLKKNAIIEMKL